MNHIPISPIISHYYPIPLHVANISQNHHRLWSSFGGLPSRRNDMPQQRHARDTLGGFQTRNWEPALRCVLNLLSIEVVLPLRVKPVDHGSFFGSQK